LTNVAYSSTGHPRFTARAANCSGAVAYGSIKSVLDVVVVGSIRNGATSRVTLEGLERAVGEPQRAVNPIRAEITPAMILGAVNVIVKFLSSGVSTLKHG
jgi:hypothetical protein